jgi:nucleoside-diphosphate-sugar epimerase
VRSPERAGELARKGAELLVGDVADIDLMTRGVRGAELAFHVAGAYALGLVDEHALERTNVGGTRAFVAALQREPTRGVYISTTQALGPADEGESTSVEAYEGPYPSVYTRTKAEAHRIARDAQRSGLPLVIVCPALVYGPGDEGPGGSYMRDVLRHRIPGLSTRRTWFSYVHVDDVVDGIIAAGERGTAGATCAVSNPTARAATPGHWKAGPHSETSFVEVCGRAVAVTCRSDFKCRTGGRHRSDRFGFRRHHRRPSTQSTR